MDCAGFSFSPHGQTAPVPKRFFTMPGRLVDSGGYAKPRRWVYAKTVQIGKATAGMVFSGGAAGGCGMLGVARRRTKSGFSESSEGVKCSVQNRLGLPPLSPGSGPGGQ